MERIITSIFGQNFLEVFEEYLKSHELSIIHPIEANSGHKGITFHGRDVGARDLAIKLYIDPLTDENREEILREYKILSQLSHPVFPRVFGILKFQYEDETYLGITEEWIKGKTLENAGRFLLRTDFLDKIKLTLDLIGALVYLQKKMEIHGDFHNENVMIQIDNFKLKIIDPGSSDIRSDNLDLLYEEEIQFLFEFLTYIFTDEQLNMIQMDHLREIGTLTELESHFEAFIEEDNLPLIDFNHEDDFIEELKINAERIFDYSLFTGDFYDYEWFSLHVCIIPSNFSETSISFISENDNKCLSEKYFQTLSPLDRCQYLTTPDSIRMYNPQKSYIILSKNGIIYFKFNYSIKRRTENIGFDWNEKRLITGSSYNYVTNHSFDFPLETYNRGNLTHVLKVLLFLYSSSNSLNPINSNTDEFKIYLQLNDMIINGERVKRVSSQDRMWMSQPASFKGDKPYIEKQYDLTFGNINSIIDDFLVYCRNYFQNDNQIAYM